MDMAVDVAVVESKPEPEPAMLSVECAVGERAYVVICIGMAPPRRVASRTSSSWGSSRSLESSHKQEPVMTLASRAETALPAGHDPSDIAVLVVLLRVASLPIVFLKPLAVDVLGRSEVEVCSPPRGRARRMILDIILRDFTILVAWTDRS